MEKIINDFTNNYPRVARFVKKLNTNYPAKMKMDMILKVSILMAKLKRGDYNKYLKDKNGIITNELIDIFGQSYLKHYCKIADEIYTMTGDYTFKINILKPDNFVSKLINQVSS